MEERSNTNSRIRLRNVRWFIMAGIAYVKKRLWNPELLIDPNGIFGKSGKQLIQTIHGSRIPIYEIVWTGATQAAEELGTAATSAKDGTTTPYIVNLVSAGATDDRDNAAGAVHSVALVGVSTNSIDGYKEWGENPNSTKGKAGKPVATVEVVAMDGATDALGTRYWIWLDHIYACEWGTGATDAAGNIDAESPTGTVLLRLLAGQNEGEGGTWHFPPNHAIVTEHVSVVPTATFAAGDGVVLTGAFTGFGQSNNTDPDLNVDFYTYTSAGGSIGYGTDVNLLRYTTLNSKVLWSEALIANSIVYDLHTIQGLHT